MTVGVRQLSAHDELGPAIQLLQRFFREDGFATPDDVIADNVEKMAAIEACGLFIAEAEGVAIGVATVSLEFGIEFGWSAEMGDLYVLPEFRGKGVAALLVQQVERFLVAKGATGYQVTVAPHGTEVELKNLYSKLGFEHEGRELLFKKLGEAGRA